MLAISATNYLHLLAMDKLNYPVKAVFIPGQRGTEVLLDPLTNKMTKGRRQNKKTSYRMTSSLKGGGGHEKNLLSISFEIVTK